MENNKRGQGGRKKDDNNPEKRSSRPPRSNSKTGASRTARTEKPFKKERSESGRDDSTGFRKDKPTEYTRSRSSGPGRPWTSKQGDDKPSGYMRTSRTDSGDDKSSGYKRSPRSDSGDYKPSGYGKQRSSGPGRPRSSERSDDKPSGYRRDTRSDSGDYKPSGYGKERSSGPGRPRSSERSDDKPSGYKRDTRSDSGDYKPSGYGKERSSGPGRPRSSERSDDKPSGYRRDTRSDSGEYKPSGYGKERSSGPGRPRSSERGDDKPSGYKREPRSDSSDYKPSGYGKERSSGPGRPRSSERGDDKPSRYGKESTAGSGRGRSSDRGEERPSAYRKPRSSYDTGKPAARKSRPVKADENAPLRLNKFIANAGVCSRREADKMIEAGAVTVNGVIVTELGTKVSPSDKVQLGEQTLSSERLRYVLLNKPKGYITTSDDPFKRNTVMNLIGDACKERIYPVGRLDRNTTGLLLFTNDGELTKRLTHPRFGVRKIYDVELDKTLSKKDMESIAAGVEFEGETIIVDEIAYVEYEKNKKHVGIELHSGQNRVVRRIFEQFGYEVLKLDRVMIGSLTKKDLQRGFWRHLTDMEVRMLKRL